MADLLDFLSFSPKRGFGSFSAYVAISEEHTDQLTISQHPVERGPEISDHAFKNPSELAIKAGWTNSSLSALTEGAEDLLAGNFGSLLSPSYASDVYSKLLALQATRQPFDITTGKRSYTNMLMRSLATTTDEHTENCLIVTASFRELIIVQTTVTNFPDASAQASPQKTGAVQNAGTKQLQPATLSPGSP